MQQDKFRIDSHKLIYHIPRVYEWIRGGDIYPIYMEVGLFSGCNQRCIFCAFDYLRYKPYALDKERFRRFVLEAARKGVKSIHYAGEGEPLMHKDAAEIVIFTKKSGIDAAITTNGTMLDREVSGKILGCLSWLRVSLDAGTRKTYSLIHNTNKENFDLVINNLKESVKIRDKHGYGCAIGVQFLLIPENYKDAVVLARLLRDTGVDYMVIKPYSQHPRSINKMGRGFRYEDMLCLENKLNRYSKDDFQIIFRRRAAEKKHEDKGYRQCLGLPFSTYVAANGDIYPCSRFLGDKSFVFGNIFRDRFAHIWKGEKRGKIMDMIYNRWDIKKCREICRLDEINRYLWELKNPCSHVNFI
jgi:radical SAM protein with 4Fe4S-binding SPASM domain